MSAFMKATFGELAPYLADSGYEPVPIPRGRKGPLIRDWQAGHQPNHYLPHVDPDTRTVTDCARHGVGLLTRNCPAVDLDVRDRELVRVLIDLAGEVLGPSPFRVGAPPKALLAFSTDEPFDKISGRWFALPGDNWRADGYGPHRIEILCDGQQVVAYARHPRGTFYRWRRGEPMVAHRIDLPEIDQAAATAFLHAAHSIIRETGAVPLVRRDKVWFPDAWAPSDFGEPEQPKQTVRRRTNSRLDSDWQRLEPEDLAKEIDAKHAKRTSDGWITSCPAHKSEGHRSLSITPRDGGGSVVHCFAECDFAEIAREISAIVGRAAA
jgi:Bifunctional DNA primase/polymerase, N-terminal